MKERIVLVVAVLAGIFAFVLTNRYLQGQLNSIYADAKKIRILAARREIPAGTLLELDDITTKEVFEKSVGRNVFFDEPRPDGTRDADRIIGKRLLYPLRVGEPIWWSFVDLPRNTGGRLSNSITSGMRALSIAVSGESAVSGLVKPDDRVDILGTFTLPSRSVPGELEVVTLTMLQDVSILATGTTTAESEYAVDGTARARAGGFNAVTLAVTPREAELLVFSETMKGRLTLSLRNPEDPSFIEDLPQINFDRMESSLPDLNRIRQRDIRHKRSVEPTSR